MRAVLHLGTYKTGSSSLQNLLHANRDLLRDNDVLYPVNGMINDPKLGFRHFPLIRDFMQGKTGVLPRALGREITESGCGTVLFSAEAWSAPLHQSHLTRFVCALEEFGFDDIQGIVLFRNLTDYHVSHFREFTVNQRNATPYRDYVRRPAGLFDYLFLLQGYRGLFGNRLQVIPYDRVDDACGAVMQAAGLADLFARLQPVPKANVKKIDALDVEAIRCCNALNIPPEHGREALARLRATDPAIAAATWSERGTDGVMPTNASYRRRFAQLSGWSASDIHRLFSVAPSRARNVADVSDRLIALMDRSASPAA